MDRSNLQTTLQSCGVNCGSRCQLRFQIRDGQIQWVETDNSHDSDELPQMRACACGRAAAHWLSCKERLNTPLKRIGPRGSGQFAPISWDEALDEIAAQLQRVVSTYGNEAIFFPFGTGLENAGKSPLERIVNLCGGHLGYYSDYSSCQLQSATMALYGDDGYSSGSSFDQLIHSDLLVMFGSTPLETRQGGASLGFRLTRLREQAKREGRSLSVISIDPRHTDALTEADDEWIPIRPGTDAAFVAGTVHELITAGLVDEQFLARYCVGFDEDTLPASAPAHSSYRSYVLGEGPDATVKTPEWAARITGCPAHRIRAFAHRLGRSQRAFITQGWGPQRSEYGEQTARAICLLALVTGNFGLPGTNSGAREPIFASTPTLPDADENPVATAIPPFLWTEAVARGPALTARSHGVRGRERLDVPIKMVINHGGNCITNQHADINAVHDILADESLCEYIVSCDIVLNDSARYADLLLPDLALAEQENLVVAGNIDQLSLLRHGGALPGSLHERRSSWDIARGLAERLGVLDAFEGEHKGSCERLSERLGSAEFPEPAPSLDELPANHECRAPRPTLGPAYEAFRADPQANSLPTPSGKVEIYSEQLARLADETILPAGQAISPLPCYIPALEGPEGPGAADFPLQFITYHGHQSVHSNFAQLDIVQSVLPSRLLVNPVDAARFGVEDGQALVVENRRGALVARARITPRIMPGVVALPNGAWHDADMTGSRLDWGCCANTLTSLSPSPLSKGNAHNSCQVRLRQLTDEERREGKERGYEL